MDGRLLREEQVAERLAVKPVTLRGWRHRGIGPKYFKVGKAAIRYLETDVEAWLAEQYELRAGGGKSA